MTTFRVHHWYNILSEMSTFQQETYEMKCYFHSGKQEVNKICLWCPQRIDLTVKDFKKVILNMFKELRETMLKEVNWGMAKINQWTVIVNNYFLKTNEILYLTSTIPEIIRRGLDRFQMAEERINKFEERSIEIIDWRNKDWKILNRVIRLIGHIAYWCVHSGSLIRREKGEKM